MQPSNCPVVVRKPISFVLISAVTRLDGATGNRMQHDRTIHLALAHSQLRALTNAILDDDPPTVKGHPLVDGHWPW
ncbi:MAG: hypothetical protein HKL82_07745 [Acidimicrobiaceae bacterium]|nr:hypothetical protein [Acidimicrobiaceae bacterium]